MNDVSDLFRQIVLIRHFEDELLRLANEGHVPGVIHPYTGQEAVAVGALAHRQPDEWVVSYYRCHGHAIACGSDPELLLREMLGRAGGLCGGKGGSMHISDSACHYLGASSIVASQLSIAGGVALGEKSRGSGRAVIVFCGDGALGAGVAYESLMIAQRFRLPLVLICEDNSWQDHTESSSVMPFQPADLLRNLGLPVCEVDGNEVEEVADAARAALVAGRRGDGPQVVVAKTFLRDFHSQLRDMAFDDEYRPAEQVAHWRDRDPVELAAARVRKLGLETEPIRDAAMAVVDRAVAGALAAPLVTPESALTAVTVASWPAADEGWWQ